MVMTTSTFTARWPVVGLMALAISLSCVGSPPGEPLKGEGATETPTDEGPVAQGAPEKALRASFPAQADAVLAQEAAFVAGEQGFVLGAARSTEAGRNLEVELPREGSGAIRLRGAGGVEVRVREIGVEGEGTLAERAVAYRRAGGTSYWTAVPAGVEEWLHLDAGVARKGETVATWDVDGATVQQAAPAELAARTAPAVRVDRSKIRLPAIAKQWELRQAKARTLPSPSSALRSS